MHTIFQQRAEENIKAAQLLFDANFFHASANRAYYAAYHAAVAAILAKGLEFNSDHKKVQAAFNGEVLRRSKTLTNDLKGYLSTMHTIRAMADYEERGISKQMAKDQLRKAHDFVSRINEELP